MPLDGIMIPSGLPPAVYLRSRQSLRFDKGVVGLHPTVPWMLCVEPPLEGVIERLPKASAKLASLLP